MEGKDGQIKSEVNATGRRENTLRAAEGNPSGSRFLATPTTRARLKRPICILFMDFKRLQREMEALEVEEELREVQREVLSRL